MNIKGYELLKKEYIDEVACEGYVFKHIKSGARVCVLSNDDTNKVFSIGFRTPVSNSTGVPHILEHSVLCGSKNFPVKDPFVELVKGSLNTFLNAMTYPDKTVYPLASYNDKDFKNLMHIYMDSVFLTNIYEHEEIFRQEGISYKLTDKDSPLEYNGVVYNEMKGAFSNADGIVAREIMHNLYPDTTYGHDSGGDPQVIPELTYEEFLDFHRKYYHPVNSYIYLYGNVDIEERLTWMDENYLSKYDIIEIDSKIKWQDSFKEQKMLEIEYPIGENDDEENKAFLTYTALLGSVLNMNEYLAFDIISYALLDSPGALIRRKLMESGIARGVNGGAEMGIYQPHFSIWAKDADLNRKDEFVKIIEDTLADVIKNGFDKETLIAAINALEFRTREADFGRFPKGLMFGLNLLDTWLYDDEAVFDTLRYNKVFEFLKEGVNNGYFEGLVKKYLLNNPHTLKLNAKPVKGLAAKRENELKEKLAAYKATLSDAEIEELVNKTKQLAEYQDKEETEEDINKIPLLDVEDIEKKAKPFKNEVLNKFGSTVLKHNIFTNKIMYYNIFFDASGVSYEDTKYLGLLTAVLGAVDTKKHSYSDISNIINTNMGGLHSEFFVKSKIYDMNDCLIKFRVTGKMLYSKVKEAFDVMSEILFETDFKDEKRLKEIIGEGKLHFENRFISAGHSVGLLRAASYYSKEAKIVDELDYYRFLCDLDENFEEKKAEAISSLERVLKQVLNKTNLIVSITADEEGCDLFLEEYEKFVDKLDEKEIVPYEYNFELAQLNEGIKTSGQVQYVVKSGDYAKEGYEYTGACEVLANILNYDYLWNNIRVKGGAYGCGISISTNGRIGFYSYRDPNLKNTIKVFDETVEYIENFKATKRDMTKYIIGAISNIDGPLSPKDEGVRSLYAYLLDNSYEKIQARRDEILNANEESIKAFAKPIKAILAQNNLCTFGSENKITEDADVFNSIHTIRQ